VYLPIYFLVFGSLLRTIIVMAMGTFLAQREDLLMT